jgi:hypothetical protein
MILTEKCANIYTHTHTHIYIYIYIYIYIITGVLIIIYIIYILYSCVWHLMVCVLMSWSFIKMTTLCYCHNCVIT